MAFKYNVGITLLQDPVLETSHNISKFDLIYSLIEIVIVKVLLLSHT